MKRQVSRRLVFGLLTTCLVLLLEGCPALLILEPEYAVVKVFYATDRNRNLDTQPGSLYGNDRGTFELGICSVSIPRDHRMGELEAPSIWKLEFRQDPAKHVVLLSVEPHSPDRFFTALHRRVADSAHKEAFVFIHGYNVNFEDAARRTAQMAYDLAFDGAPILYSWPSKGQLLLYPVDETNVEWTVPHLKNFLTEVASKSGAGTIHLIAHSMGNRGLTSALQDIAQTQPQPDMPMFRQVVLAAPDIDAGVFKALAREIKQAAQRITLYASSNDEALVASKKFHGYPRAGDSGDKIVIVPGIDTIDVSVVDTSLVGHSYYGDNRSMLSDLFNLLRSGSPPDQRFGLTPKEVDGSRYWVFRP